MRINIECAFGILVSRWGMLRKPLPPNLHVSKVVSLVCALCNLHNFCINENEVFSPSQEGEFVSSNPDPENMGSSYLPNVGYVASERTDDLLDANDDRSGASRSRNFNATDLPRTKMLSKVEDFGFLERPICNMNK